LWDFLLFEKAITAYRLMTRKSELLAAFDAAWDANWESLSAALKDVTEEEALFQHPVYSDAKKRTGFPANGSILWHVVHLAECYRLYVRMIEQRPHEPEDAEAPKISTLQEGIAYLKDERAALRHAIDALDDTQLDEMLYYGKPILSLCRGTVRHDAWHGGQIVVARRLYRMRERS
jgi:uncharacterized damage-inducible protein DinB